MDYADFLAELQEFMTQLDDIEDPGAHVGAITERFSAEEIAELRHNLERVLTTLPPSRTDNPVH